MSAPWLIPEPAPDPHRQNLLVYSSCHTTGILRYLRQHRPEVACHYNITGVVIHLAAEDPTARDSAPFLDAFHQADFLLHHPLASEKWGRMRAEDIGLRPSCLRVAMESPQLSCAWPFARGSGELPIQRMLSEGKHESDIRRAFDSGEMEMYFPERYVADIERMYRREETSDLKAAAFVEEHWKDQKMFFTENHPTMAVLGYMTDQFLARMGHVAKGAAHALALPLATMEGDNHFPETRYEWEAYQFRYSRQYERNLGGSLHYHRIIEAACAAYLNR